MVRSGWAGVVVVVRLLALTALWVLAAAAQPLAVGREADVPLEDFQKAGAGQTWPGWGRAQGLPAASCALSVTGERQRLVGRVTFTQAAGTLMLPVPEVTLVGRPTALRLRGRLEGGGLVRLGATLVDATGNWWSSAGTPLEGSGWREYAVSLADLRRVEGSGGQGTPLAPIALWTLNVEFPVPKSGALELDDLLVEQAAWAPLDYLQADLAGAGGSRLVRLDAAPPRLTLLNRGPSETVVGVRASSGGSEVSDTLRVPARGTAHLVLPAASTPGPLLVRAALRAGHVERQIAREYAVLPPLPAAADPTRGVGRYTLDDVLEGRFVADLPDLQACSAGWTALRLVRAGPPAPLPEDLWAEIGHSLSVAQALGVRPMLWASAYAVANPNSDGGLTVEALGRLAPLAVAAALDPIELADTERLPDLLPAVEAATGGACPVLTVEVAPSGAAGRLLALPRLLRAPAGPFPRGWRALSDWLGQVGPSPLWVATDGWPAAALSDSDDQVAAAAQAALAVRSVPRLLGFGLLQPLSAPLDGEPGLAISRPLVAWAVASAMLAGLQVSEVRQVAPDTFELLADSDQRTLRAVWSEGQPTAVERRPGETAYDALGTLASGTTLTAGARPLYFVSETAATG